jgi:hypothetical protein
MNGYGQGTAWWQRIFCADAALAADPRAAAANHEWNYLWLLPGDAALTAPGLGPSGVPAPGGTAP